MDINNIILETGTEEEKELFDHLQKHILLDEIAARGATKTQIESTKTQFEKLELTEMRPEVLAAAPDTEIRQAWLRLNQWFNEAKAENRAVEDFVNAAVWVAAEMENRGFEIDKELPLYEAIEDFKESIRGGLMQRFYNLPKELVVVRDFVSIVGSAAKGKLNPGDIDILFRALSDNNGNFLIQDENIWLPVRNVVDPQKEDLLHFINNPQGAHGDYVSMYDLVLRKKPAFRRTIVKSASEMPNWREYEEKAPEGLKIDLGCGDSKPEGYMGIDLENFDGVDIIADLGKGIPLQDNTAAILRANHFIEHIFNSEMIMSEIYRVLKPGGVAIITVPSTEGDGAFAHPGHRSFYNKSTFEFWTNPELIEDRPKFENVFLQQREEGELKYIDAVLKKPLPITKEFKPFQKFTPPKPTMAQTTEAFELDELFKWAEEKYPITIEEKLNGFRAIALKLGQRVALWFEGQLGKNQIDKVPEIKEQLEKIDGDFILDTDLSIKRDGKKLPRPELMRFNRDKVEFAENETPILTIFDLPYWNEDISKQGYEQRRKTLEGFYNGEITNKDIVKLPFSKIARNDRQAKAAAAQAFRKDRSEGLVAKSNDSEYKEGGIAEWFKLKKAVELKVIVLDKVQTKTPGVFNYHGGLMLSEGQEWTNTTTFDGKAYIDLGRTFNSKINASKGDILTTSILELIPDTEMKKLAWLGATVLDIDETRKEPFSAAQAIDIARRGEVLQKLLKQFVPPTGGQNVDIAFIGALPDKLEAVRGENLVGPTGKVFNEMYLEPLGLERKDVFLCNLIPEVSCDIQNENTEDVVKEWGEWLEDEIQRANPKLVVALSQTARYFLKEKADFVLPHPNAIRKFGDRGELTRKLRQIKKAIKLAKQIGEEGGGVDTRAAQARRFWRENWHNMFPIDGKGKFVYQQHWRGLTEDESKLDQKELLNTKNSVHGDIRLSAKDDESLWGFSIFLGTAEANKKAGGDRLKVLPADDKLQGTFKLEQPGEWLDAASGKPLISEPGGVGATAQGWAKFFEQDKGSYEIGVWRQNAYEIFLDGKDLKGRYLIQFAPVGEEGRRVWLISKPEDQTPIAEKRELNDLIKELKEKGQDWLIWAKPGEKPRKINVKEAKIEKEYFAEIMKADEEKRIITGIVLEPDTIDAHNDTISAEEIEKAAHFFMQNSRTIGERHKKPAQAQLIESFIAPDGFKINNTNIKKGTWIISVKILDEDTWAKVKDGYFTGFSVGGFGVREEGK